MTQVDKVLHGSSAEKHGLRTGDIILSVDGVKTFDSIDDVNALIIGAPGSKVVIRLHRDKKEFDVAIIRENLIKSTSDTATYQTASQARAPQNHIESEVVQIGGEDYLVIKPYSAQLKHELSLCAGEIVHVQRKHAKGWWEGSVQGESSRKGWFPSKIVQPIERNSVSASTSHPETAHYEAPSSADDGASMIDHAGSCSESRILAQCEDGEDGDERDREEWDAEADWCHRRESQRLARKAAVLLGHIRAALPSVSGAARPDARADALAGRRGPPGRESSGRGGSRVRHISIRAAAAAGGVAD